MLGVYFRSLSAFLLIIVLAWHFLPSVLRLTFLYSTANKLSTEDCFGIWSTGSNCGHIDEGRVWGAQRNTGCVWLWETVHTDQSKMRTELVEHISTRKCDMVEHMGKTGGYKSSGHLVRRDHRSRCIKFRSCLGVGEEYVVGDHSLSLGFHYPTPVLLLFRLSIVCCLSCSYMESHVYSVLGSCLPHQHSTLL